MTGFSKARVQAALEGEDPVYGRLVGVLVYVAIIASGLVITLQSMPEVESAIRAQLWAVELVLLAIFVTEFGFRVWSAPSRSRYIFSFWGIIDLLAILPALLFLFPDSQTLRALRLLRVFRLLKLFRMRKALLRLENALEQSKDELLLFMFLSAIILYLAAVGIHHFEKVAQPESFGTIPKALWWALATLTTVGYGDVYPVTTGGKAFTGLTLLVGLGVVAIPAGIITSALLSAPETEENLSHETTERDDDEP